MLQKGLLILYPILPVDPLPHTPNSPTRSETHSGNLRTLATAYGMVDILALHHSTRPFAPTYIRGK